MSSTNHHSPKTIFITGASRGIGFETSLVLADNGHQVIATARSADRLAELHSRNDDRIRTIPADLTASGDIEKIYSSLRDDGIRLDGIVNNAGLLINKPFESLSDHNWQQMHEVNLFSPVRLTRELLPLLNKNSHILNISSMGGVQQSRKFRGLTGYSVTKGGLLILTECLAEELGPQNISANCLCLGAVETEMFNEAFPGMSAPVQPEQMGTYIADFVLRGHQLYNGRTLQVALADPE